MKATLSETEFQDMVLSLARLYGWRTAHFRPGMTRKGKWRTAVAGDGAGFPDLLLVRKNVLIVAELKVGKNVCTREQAAWLAAFEAAGVPAYLWTPAMWDTIEGILKEGPP